MIVSSLPVKHNHHGYVLPLDWSPMLYAALYSCCKMSVRFEVLPSPHFCSNIDMVCMVLRVIFDVIL